MTTSNQVVKVPHLDGGNFFDDMRIDIAESHRRFVHLPRKVKDVKKPRLHNIIRFYFTALAIRLGIHEFLIVNGVKRRWLDDFRDYWSNILNGRPFWNTLDFFMLLHDYRKRQQNTSQLDWSDPKQHLKNWQHPSQIYSTLHTVRQCAMRPIIGFSLWNKITKGMRILEYGCSLAPYYYCYREFFSHLNCKWSLADIPNFPFHYAKYLYRNDPDVEFITINDVDFTNPLGEASEFDVILLTTVLEHLDDPLFISGYLLKRLKTGGLLVFDYIKSEGKGLDHPRALEMRQECLRSILAQTQIVNGKINDINESISLCIAKKKNVL